MQLYDNNIYNRKQISNNKATFEQEIENITNTLNRKIKNLENELSSLRKLESHNKEKSSNTKSSAFITETKVEKKEGNSSKDIDELKSKVATLEGQFLYKIRGKRSRIK